MFLCSRTHKTLLFCIKYNPMEQAASMSNHLENKTGSLKRLVLICFHTNKQNHTAAVNLAAVQIIWKCFGHMQSDNNQNKIK
jgi:hypothetical protein